MLQLAALIACMTHREMQHRPSAAAALTPGTIWNDPLHVPRVFVERFCSNHIPNKSPCIDHISNSANNQLTKVTRLYCSNGVCAHLCIPPKPTMPGSPGLRDHNFFAQPADTSNEINVCHHQRLTGYFGSGSMSGFPATPMRTSRQRTVPP